MIYVNLVVTAPEWQGHGFASALLHKVTGLVRFSSKTHCFPQGTDSAIGRLTFSEMLAGSYPAISRTRASITLMGSRALATLLSGTTIQHGRGILWLYKS